MENVRKRLKIGEIEKNGISGKNVVVAILDSGVERHPDLKDKIIYWKDFVNNRYSCYDDNGHGTHVAGIIGGKCQDRIFSKMKINGIAVDCRLISLKVLDNKGIGKEDNVINALNWIIDNHKIYNIRIVNISFGTKTLNEDDCEIIKYVDKLWDSGLVVVAAAGNNGPDFNTITIPGSSKKIITVGVYEDGHKVRINGKYISDYSGRGPTFECVQKPELIAYGNKIVSCNKNFNNKMYTMKSGTSMATPVVSGCLALLISKNHNISNVDVKRVIKDSCTDLGLNKNVQGWGLVNPVKMLSL